jgi:phosphatidylglycerol---prolipoprotein diacylglyceryl transferase
VHPIIFKAGGFVVYSYSLMVALAFSAALIYSYYEAKRLGEDPAKVVDCGIYVFIACMVGGRLMHCLINYRIYLHDPVRIFKFWEGGLVFYGGEILGSLTIVVYVLVHKLNLAKWADLSAYVPMIGLFFGRIGCFLNGCCYGSAAQAWLPWKVKYPPGMMPLELAGVPLHPAPLYEALAVLLIFLFLVWRSRHKKFDSEIMWLMFLLYGVARFFLEFWRADERGGVAAIRLSTSQIIAVLFILPSGFFLLKNYLAPRTAEAHA